MKAFSVGYWPPFLFQPFPRSDPLFLTHSLDRFSMPEFECPGPCDRRVCHDQTASFEFVFQKMTIFLFAAVVLPPDSGPGVRQNTLLRLAAFGWIDFDPPFLERFPAQRCARTFSCIFRVQVPASAFVSWSWGVASDVTLLPASQPSALEKVGVSPVPFY